MNAISSANTRVLFVCLGNICRSPAAEAVMTKLVKDSRLDQEIWCDSAGTQSYHSGERADQRMRSSAASRDIDITSIARGVQDSDFEEFDWIVAMDKSNYRDLIRRGQSSKGKANIVELCSYCRKSNPGEVPDPYYGGPEGFEHVLDLLEDGCDGLLSELKSGL